MPDTMIDVTTQIANLRARSRTLPLVSHVTWQLRKATRDDSLEAAERLAPLIADIAAGAAADGVTVENGGVARITAGTSGKYTGVVVLVTAPGQAARVVVLSLE